CGHWSCLVVREGIFVRLRRFVCGGRFFERLIKPCAAADNQRGCDGELSFDTRASSWGQRIAGGRRSLRGGWRSSANGERISESGRWRQGCGAHRSTYRRALETGACVTGAVLEPRCGDQTDPSCLRMTERPAGAHKRIGRARFGGERRVTQRLQQSSAHCCRVIPCSSRSAGAPLPRKVGNSSEMVVECGRESPGTAGRARR